MIRVGFTIIDGKVKWMGGVNYLKNLLYAISMSKDRKIEPVLFLGNKVDEKIVKEFEQLAEIQRHDLFDRGSLLWMKYTFLRDILRVNPDINYIIKRYNIQAFSHSYIYGPDIQCVKINWIPDFQHLRLPHLYSRLHLFVRGYRLQALAKYSDAIILSSFDALNDLKKFAPKYAHKARVIHFVSQTTAFIDNGIEYLKQKYGIGNSFFFLPNQFWIHKNHSVAFQAVKIVKKKLPDITLICSGHLDDNRDAKHITELRSFIKSNYLDDNIKLLGLIPFDDVLLFMKHSIAVINPSYFEGWSSTVEESKSMKKSLILSDIPVHREQAPSRGTFFNPDNADELAALLIQKWLYGDRDVDSNTDDIDIKDRTREFGENFQSVVMEFVVNKHI